MRALERARRGRGVDLPGHGPRRSTHRYRWRKIAGGRRRRRRPPARAARAGRLARGEERRTVLNGGARYRRCRSCRTCSRGGRAPATRPARPRRRPRGRRRPRPARAVVDEAQQALIHGRPVVPAARRRRREPSCCLARRRRREQSCWCAAAYGAGGEQHGVALHCSPHSSSNWLQT